MAITYAEYDLLDREQMQETFLKYADKLIPEMGHNCIKIATEKIRGNEGVAAKFPCASNDDSTDNLGYFS